MYLGMSKKYLPWLALILGVVGLVLRRWLYAVAVDGRGLLESGHPLEIGLWCLSAVSLGWLVYAAWKLDGEQGYEANFPASLAGGVGQVLAGVGILAVVLLSQSQYGPPNGLWRLLGFLSGPCLMGAGICRSRGRKPFFLLHLIPCLFLVIHVIDHYRVWSSDPQLQNYVFSLFGYLSLMLFAFYNASYEAGLGHRRMQVGTGLAVVYLCTVSLAPGADLWLHLGAIAWAVTGLCQLEKGV